MSDFNNRDACSVTLVITGHDLDPDAVTKILGIPPSQSWKRGDIKKFRSGQTHTYAFGGWKLFHSQENLNEPLYKQLEYWILFLTNNIESLKQINKMTCAVVLDFYLSIDDSFTIDFGPELVRRIADIGIGMKLNCFASEIQ